jgi:hypothetical protein
MITNNVGSGIGPAIGLATNAIVGALRGEAPDPEIVFNREAIAKWKSRFAGSSLLAAAATAR